MPDWLYDGGPNGLWVFLLVTLLMGGAAAIVSGRAIAQTWRPQWQVPFYMALLALAVRFIHYAIFGEVLLSARNYLVDLAALVTISLLAFRQCRAQQMLDQYGFLADPKSANSH
ncbi:MAG: hypothetical protein R3D67_02425 [Hyphomicrobiaceae bacterium]